jgi:hypothetical protein
MVTQISAFTRNSVILTFWLVLTSVFVASHLLVVLAKYMGCATALELAGFEQMPLAKDKLMGPFIGAFLGEGTLSSLLALTIAVITALFFISIFHIGFQTFYLWFDRSVYVDP